MKQAAKTKNQPSPAQKNNPEKEVTEYMKLILPPGLKFDDIYMDAPQVAQELNISKRVLRNVRVNGKISYTNPFGKVFYYRQEIAAIMEASKKAKKGM
jgi:hypothetical protein